MAENDFLIENPQVPDIVFEQVDYKLEFYGDIQGESLYVSWLGLGNAGTKEDFLLWLKGADGKSVEMQKTATHIQWRLVGSDAWVDIVALANITGSNGKSAYQSYLDTTTDNPPMTEQAWSNQLGDINAALTALLAIEL